MLDSKFFQDETLVDLTPSPLSPWRGELHSFIFLHGTSFENLNVKLKVPKRITSSPLSPCGERGRGIEVRG